MNVQELSDYAGGFVEYSEDVAAVVDTLLDMRFGLPHPDAQPDERAGARAVAEFEKATGATAEWLVGRYWALVDGRVFIADV